MGESCEYCGIYVPSQVNAVYFTCASWDHTQANACLSRTRAAIADLRAQLAACEKERDELRSRVGEIQAILIHPNSICPSCMGDTGHRHGCPIPPWLERGRK